MENKTTIKTIKLEVSKLTASCLQRMIADEISSQEYRCSTDEKEGYTEQIPVRKLIIEEMETLAIAIENQGVNRHNIL